MTPSDFSRLRALAQQMRGWSKKRKLDESFRVGVGLCADALDDCLSALERQEAVNAEGPPSWRTPEWVKTMISAELGDSTGSAGDYEQQAVQETVAAGPVDTPAVESPSSRDTDLHRLAEEIKDLSAADWARLGLIRDGKALAEWALCLERERDSLRWQLQTFERETEKRIEKLKNAESDRDSYRQDAKRLEEELKQAEQERDHWKDRAEKTRNGQLARIWMKRAEQAEAALAECQKDCDAVLRANQAKHQLMVKAETELAALRDGLATLRDQGAILDALLPVVDALLQGERPVWPEP